jgi:hypothetical protein
VNELTKDAEAQAAHIRIEAVAKIGKLCPATDKTTGAWAGRAAGGKRKPGEQIASSQRKQAILPAPRLTEARKLAKIPELRAGRIRFQPPVRGDAIRKRRLCSHKLGWRCLLRRVRPA